MKSFVSGLVAIKPTSTEIERVFSTAVLVLNDRRVCMSTELFDAIVIINKIYKN